MNTPLFVFHLLIVAALGSPQRDLNQIIRQVFTSTSTVASDVVPFDGLELVPTTTQGSYGAIARCGEGDDVGRRACVRYHSCDRNGRLIADETPPPTNKSPGDVKNLIDLRLGSAGGSSCSHSHYLDVCCDISGNRSATTTSEDLLGGRGMRRPTSTTTTTQRPSFAGCGIRNENGIDFTIIGNPDESQYGEFPWMVALMSKREETRRGGKFALCGGSLIRNNVVMTAAHCVNR